MKRLAVVAALAAWIAVPVWAEVNPTNSTGVEPPYSYKGGLNEAVNLYNGNLNLTLPLFSLKGRAGMDVNLYLTYDSRQVNVVSDPCSPSGKAAWNYTGPTFGRWVPSFTPHVVESVLDGIRRAEVQLEGGARHLFVETSPNSGRSTNLTDMVYDFYYKTVSTKSGIWYKFSDPTRILKVDSNGNYIAFIRDVYNRTTQIQDSLGRTVNITYDTNPYNYLSATQITVLNNAGRL